MRLPKNKKNKLIQREDLEAYTMILPFFIFFILFFLLPLLMNVINSFTNYDLSQTKEFIGIQNYAKLFKDKDFIRAFLNTAVYAVLSVFPLAVLGLVAAIAVNRRSAIIKAATTLFIFPYVTSMVAVSMIWLLLYEPTNGIFNKLLAVVGFGPFKWLFDENLALPALIAMNIWKNVGYVMIIYLGGLQSIPIHLYESATIDGASDFNKLTAITLPMLSPITFFVFVTLFVEALKTFDSVSIMTGGGPVNSTTTIVHQIYIRSFSEFKMGYASAMSVILFAVTLIVVLVNFRFGAGREQL